MCSNDAVLNNGVWMVKLSWKRMDSVENFDIDVWLHCPSSCGRCDCTKGKERLNRLRASGHNSTVQFPHPEYGEGCDIVQRRTKHGRQEAIMLALENDSFIPLSIGVVLNQHLHFPW